MKAQEIGEEAWQLVGTPSAGGLLIVGDHASGFVPHDIDLDIDRALLTRHIALDIGVTEVARSLVHSGQAEAALLASVSRLVIDLNRAEHAPGLIPIASDGHAIAGNALSPGDHAARIDRFYRPYHARLADIVTSARPAIILSLHSFTPVLESRPEDLRPWHIGILYNDDDRLGRLALPALAAMGLTVGDQLPYSGKLLNHSMNVHAEANGIPYLGLEMRQDLVRDTSGQVHMAEIIGLVLDKCRHHLAQITSVPQ